MKRKSPQQHAGSNSRNGISSQKDCALPQGPMQLRRTESPATPEGSNCLLFDQSQVHTFDDLSLVETLEAQPITVESALQFCDRDLIVSPITLRPRFNPNATNPAKQSEDLSSAADPRQSTLFCATWTVGSLARFLPLDRVESLTFYETSGPRGHSAESHLADLNPTRPAKRYSPSTMSLRQSPAFVICYRFRFLTKPW
jgi:hypothetical protein